MLFTTTHRSHIYYPTWTSILTSPNSPLQSADASSTSSTTSLLPIRPIAAAATCCCPSHTPTTTRSDAKTLTSSAPISPTTLYLFRTGDSLKSHLNNTSKSHQYLSFPSSCMLHIHLPNQTPPCHVLTNSSDLLLFPLLFLFFLRQTRTSG